MREENTTVSSGAAVVTPVSPACNSEFCIVSSLLGAEMTA